MHSNHARAHKESVKLTGEGNYASSVKGGFSSEPRKDKLCFKCFFSFSSLYLFVQICGAIQMNAAQILKPPRVLDLSALMTLMTSVTDISLIGCFLFFFN